MQKWTSLNLELFLIVMFFFCGACAESSFRSGGARIPQASSQPDGLGSGAKTSSAPLETGGNNSESGRDSGSGSGGGLNERKNDDGAEADNGGTVNQTNGNTTGGNTTGGNTAGGNTTGGNTTGGNTTGGNNMNPMNTASPAPHGLGPVDLQKFCRSLLSLGSNENCRFPAKQIFGGSFQSGTVEILNPKTGTKSCPSGFRTFTLASVSGVQPANRNELGTVTVSICLSEGNRAAEVASSSCPAGQSPVAFGSQTLCSDVAKRACSSLNGVFNAQAGTCQLIARETVYGGMFETGDVQNAGTARVINPDDNNKETEEKCETPNSFAGFSTCKCGAGFRAASSSNFAEPSDQFDRFTYCFSAEKFNGLAPKVTTPQSGCLLPNEEKFVVGSETKCLTTVSDLCTSLGGNYQTITGKCSLPGSTFFGGSFQIGFSNHRKFGPLPDNLKDPLLGTRQQFCEAPNQRLAANLINSAAGCSCPAGFSRHALAMIEEPSDGDYDREYLCIAN